MYAILTKYFGPTNAHGSRIKATTYGASVTVPIDHALNSRQNHDRAADKCVEKARLNGYIRLDAKYIGAELPDDTGYAYVPVP